MRFLFNIRQLYVCLPILLYIFHLSPQNQSQTNGYVAYVDYSRDYAPPATDSLSGSLSRSIDGSYPSQGSLMRQASCGRLSGLVGPDGKELLKYLLFDRLLW